MADNPVGIASPNSASMEDTFEQDLKEMLKDAPSLNDLSGPVQAGTMNTEGKPQAYIRPDSAQPRPTTAPSMPRSHTVPPATSTIPLSSPERNGQNGPQKPAALVTPAASKLDTIKSWSINTYKFTRQMISERLGKGSKTVDMELEGQIENLRDTQRKYANILHLARALSSHFYHVVQTQRALGETFAGMSQKAPELQEEFSYNAETQKTLCKNGEALIGALNFFTSSVNTLCHKTMEDTLQTIKQYENARVEFDAYRCDLDALQNGPRDSTTMQRIEDAQKRFLTHKEKYDRLKGDVSIKLKFLDENRVTVSQKQLYLLQQAFRDYVAGNQMDLEALTEQFNLQPKYPVEPIPASSGPTTPEGN